MTVCLYDGSRSNNLKWNEIISYLKENLPNFETEVRPDFFPYFLSLLPAKGKEKKLDCLSQKLSEAKVLNLTRREIHKPLRPEIEYEKKRILNLNQKVFGLVYDGLTLQYLCGLLLPDEENKYDRIHIIITNQLFATYETDRWHLRTSIYGTPSLISTNGLVQAPARDRAFYLTGVSKEDYLKPGDERLTEVLKGYIMQAVFFHLTGEPFCSDKGCRLYNAHWQKELIYAQIESPYEFCPGHEQIRKQINNS